MIPNPSLRRPALPYRLCWAADPQQREFRLRRPPPATRFGCSPNGWQRCSPSQNRLGFSGPLVDGVPAGMPFNRSPCDTPRRGGYLRFPPPSERGGLDSTDTCRDGLSASRSSARSASDSSEQIHHAGEEGYSVPFGSARGPCDRRPWSRFRVSLWWPRKRMASRTMQHGCGIFMDEASMVADWGEYPTNKTVEGISFFHPVHGELCTAIDPQCLIGWRLFRRSEIRYGNMLCLASRRSLVQQEKARDQIQVRSYSKRIRSHVRDKRATASRAEIVS